VFRLLRSLAEGILAVTGVSNVRSIITLPRLVPLPLIPMPGKSFVFTHSSGLINPLRALCSSPVHSDLHRS
jgi:hypothetical protein